MTGEDLINVFGAGSLTNNYRIRDITLFERVADGKEHHVHQNLTLEMMETMWKLTLTEVRRESTECEATINAQMKTMQKKQFEPEEQIRQLLSQRNQINNSMSDDDDMDDHEYDDVD